MVSYQRWLSTLVETRKGATTFGAWLGMSTTVTLILLAVSFIEPFRTWFQLDFWPALSCFSPMMAMGLIAGWGESAGRITLRMFGALILVGAFLFQFFWAALVLMCEAPGSLVMGCFFLLTVTFHGYLHRVTLRYPFGLLPTILALLAAWSLRPASAGLPLLLFIGITGVLLSLLVGGVGLRMHYNAVQSDLLKQALYYRELNEKARESTEMSRRVLDLLKYNHDAGNTLSAVFVHAQLLEERVAQSSAKTPDLQHFAAPITTLLVQLGRLKALISQAHRVADAMPVVETVSVVDVIDEVTRECRALFPGVSIQLENRAHGHALLVKMHEGQLGLRRVVENILRNACEGNGSATAGSVQIRLTANDGHVVVSFSDDGPGFADTQLMEPPLALSTTKRDGHGLGLYNVNELVLASGGTLSRRNSDAGGAIVDVVLKMGSVL